MWFGTEDGLNRYDGYSFSIYRPNSANTNSVIYKWIEQIVEDDNGLLWLGSRGGLSVFNPRTEVFHQFRNIAIEEASLYNDTIKVLESYSGAIWVGTQQGLNVVDCKTFEVSRIADIRGQINELLVDTSRHCLWVGTDQNVFSVQCSNDKTITVNKLPYIEGAVFDMILWNHKLWLAMENALFSDSFESEVQRFELPKPMVQEGGKIERLIPHNGHMYLGLNIGLVKFTIDNARFTWVISADDVSNSLSINPYKSVLSDSKGNLWFGTFGQGLYRLNDSDVLHHFVHNPADNKSLAQNAINCLYEDRSGVLWIGTFGAGMSVYDPWANKFELIKHNPLNPNSLSSNFVWTMWEDTDGSIWIGTNDKGICHYQPDTGLFLQYEHKNGNPGSLSHNSIRDVFQDHEGVVWVGTDGGGLNKYNRSTDTFQRFQHDISNPQSISHNSVRVIYEDRENRLWIGTRGGLNLFDRKTESFKRFLHDPNDSTSISHNFVYSSIYDDGKGALWIGTYGGGLNRLDLKTMTFQSYQKQADGQGLSDNIVFSIYGNERGGLWLGTNGGFNYLDPAKKQIKVFGISDGLPNEVVYGIIPDDAGNLWLSTNNGISRFHPQNRTFDNYDIHDGLQSNEFNGGAFHRGKSGKLYFGGVYGINVIDPMNLPERQKVEKAVMTNFEVLGYPVYVKPGEKGINPGRLQEEQGRYFVNKHIAYLEQLELKYKQRFFAFEFSGMHHSAPQKIHYSCMLKGLDREWQPLKNRNYISYSNVPPGQYTFMVKAQNSDGVWQEEPTSLSVIVKPPFWLTWWFILLEVIIVIAIIVLGFSYVIKLRTNKMLRYQHALISQANDKLKRSEEHLKQTNATKDKFFSIISHDLKNPFSSLLSISDLMVRNYDSTGEEEKKQCVISVHHSLKQVYGLLENLLTWSRAQSGRLSFNPVSFNVSLVVQECINLFRLPAEKKDIQLQSNLDDDYLAWGDREMIQTVIRNLVGNAIKFTPKGGLIELTVGLYDDQVTFQVRDTGQGIPKENIDKLFRIEYKVKTVGTNGEKGTGLGLILCKEFVEKNGGTIHVESEVGVGSTFSFTLPRKEK
jgi:ligand-binding sensor domain-containing protein/signal transduction histidine kinase